MASIKSRRLALVAAITLASASLASAQQHHGGHGGHHGGGQQQGMGGDMDRMRGMMRQMQGMMDRMQSASPADRERMMNEMRPMMQQMMPMMQGMMGQGGGSEAGGGHQGHGQPARSAAVPDSTKAFEDVNAKMHRDMAIAFSGNPDVDFVRGMIPHHQGAIDMAQVALKFGKDEWVKKLAQEVIAAQTREIAEMREWLAKNPR